MAEKRREGRGSILQGSLVHNQRIERLWRDIREMVTEYFRLLLHLLEWNNFLNPSDEMDLAALHYVFIPRINENLESLRCSGTIMSYLLKNNRLQTSLVLVFYSFSNCLDVRKGRKLP